MKKATLKLIISVVFVVVAASLAVVASFAWMTLSAEPEVGGIEIRIGGGTTIMIAPDVVVRNSDGSISHYPGSFSQNMSFLGNESYSYLHNLAPLTPVSTADGEHWILPAYYSADDPEVKQGTAVVGQLKGYAELPVDTTLAYANIAKDQQGEGRTGSYVYVDFWVVSPGEDYQLRVSAGDGQGETGSFLISRMEAVSDGNGGYSLIAGDETASASARIGFLVNSDWSPYRDTQLYLGSPAYDERYSHLRGTYQESGEPLENFSAANNTFTVYEPNGDLHADGSGNYLITNPLGVSGGSIYPQDISQRLTVQLTNRWKQENGECMLQQEFAAAMVEKSDFVRPEDAMEYLYGHRLQGVIAPYVDKGLFVSNTQALYAEANEKGVVDSGSVALHTADTATESVVITTLEKNVPQRIRLFIWLEGQDADCVNHEAFSGFILSLELAGS